MTRREVGAIALGAFAPAVKGPAVGGLSLNEDNSHYFSSRGGKRITVADLDQFIDQYAGTQVKELLFSVNSMRTSYASKVWDPIWRGYVPDGPDDQPLFKSLAAESRAGARRWVHSAWHLAQDGIDIYARWIARSRAKGMSPWVSMRMNDVHNTDDPACYIHSEFWREHPEYRRVPYKFEGLTDRAFDYGRKEVRDYHMKLVVELAERYDFDGLELDWMRFGYHFKPGREAEGAVLLTEFTAEVRRILDSWGKRRGRRIQLSARVPSRPQSALALGMDGVEWARRGLVDSLVITPFWQTIESDMPVETWKQLLRGTKVTLSAGLEVIVRPYNAFRPIQMNSLETVRGAAAAMLDRGADRVYLFNYMDSDTAMEGIADYPALLREIGQLATLEGKPRRHIMTYADTWAPGEARAVPLPRDIPANGWSAFRLATGPKPGRLRTEVRLSFESGSIKEVRLNGVLCRPRTKRELPKPKPNGEALIFEAPGEAVQRAANVVEVQASGAGKMHWVEIAFVG